VREKEYKVSLTLDLLEYFYAESEEEVRDKVLEFITESKFYKKIQYSITENLPASEAKEQGNENK
jgi:hypothetical protein